MSNFSFEDIGAVVATFAAGQEVKGGQVVKLTDNATVAPCIADDKFCGVAMQPRQGGAAVQVKGFCTVTCSGSLTPGWATLVADGTGGVKTAAAGVDALVVSVDANGTAVVCL